MAGWYFAGAVVFLLLGLWLSLSKGGNNSKDK